MELLECDLHETHLSIVLCSNLSMCQFRPMITTTHLPISRSRFPSPNQIRIMPWSFLDRFIFDRYQIYTRRNQKCISHYLDQHDRKSNHDMRCKTGGFWRDATISANKTANQRRSRRQTMLSQTVNGLT